MKSERSNPANHWFDVPWGPFRDCSCCHALWTRLSSPTQIVPCLADYTEMYKPGISNKVKLLFPRVGMCLCQRRVVSITAEMYLWQRGMCLCLVKRCVCLVGKCFCDSINMYVRQRWGICTSVSALRYLYICQRWGVCSRLARSCVCVNRVEMCMPQQGCVCGRVQMNLSQGRYRHASVIEEHWPLNTVTSLKLLTKQVISIKHRTFLASH